MPDLQLLVIVALMIDAFILGASWQLLSDPKRRRNIFRRFSSPAKTSVPPLAEPD
ncbi:MAG TPA: hypothetical protein VED17_07715 [Nitrososphaerales archaeon]|nr:hypothetical protein [Nitrososphaerales archaeon]